MSYGLKYTVPFKTISDKACVVQIEVRDYTGASYELIAGGTPFVIDTDRSDLLTPIRASSATLAVYGSCYLQDLYTSDPQGIRITLLKEGQVEWIGFVTQDTFSQDFSKPEFIYEMECVSALSTLKHKKFDFDPKEYDFVTFLDIIRRARDLAGYSDLYLTRSVRPVLKPPTIIDGLPIFHLPFGFHSLRIASANFYDELSEAMTYYEVLEEIAKFAGCTFTPYKNDLYLIDYAAIRRGFNTYERIVGDANPVLGVFPMVTLADSRTINEYKGTGTRLSRIAGRNKATVIGSLYEVGKNIVTFDDERSEFVNSDENETSWGSGSSRRTRFLFIRHFNQPKFTFYRYQWSGGDFVRHETSDFLSDNEVGSGFVRTAGFELGRNDPYPERLSFTNEVLVRRYTNENQRLGAGAAVFTMGSNGNIISVPGAFFCISFEWMVVYGRDWWSRANVGSSGDNNRLVRVSLRMQNLYYNGNKWVDRPAIFLIPIRINGDTFNVYHRTRNTNDFTHGMPDVSGFLVPSPPGIVSGMCELTLYYVGGHSSFLAIPPKYSYYKNIQLSYAIPSEDRIWGDWVDEDSKNDIIYENVIDDSFVDAADEINLKICTPIRGKIALSFVLDGRDFLEDIVSDVFGTDIAEHILLKRVIDMFRAPRFVIDPVLRNDLKPYTMLCEQFLPGTHLLCAGGEEDIKMERVKTNLIEML